MYLPFCDLPHVYTSPEELTTAVCCWPQDNLTGLHRNSTVLSGCEQQIREIQLILSTLLSLIKEIFTLILNEMGELSTQGKSTAQQLQSSDIWIVTPKDFSHRLISQNHLSTTQHESYRVFSHDVTAAILVTQNNEMVAMLVSQTSPVGVELLSYANAFFCSNKFA